MPSIISSFGLHFHLKTKQKQAFCALYISVAWCTSLKLYQRLTYMTVNCIHFCQIVIQEYIVLFLQGATTSLTLT